MDLKPPIGIPLERKRGPISFAPSAQGPPAKKTKAEKSSSSASKACKALHIATGSTKSLTESSDNAVDKVNHDHKILVAVDFGTTYTGAIWVESSTGHAPELVDQWPNAHSRGIGGVTRDRVPTQLRYEDDGIKWGYQIREDAERHRWFKLDLDRVQLSQSALSCRYKDRLAAPPDYQAVVPDDDHPNAEQYIDDYLSAFRHQVMRVLQHRVPSSVFPDLPILWTLTMPAMWRDGTKKRFRACAERAGMGRAASIQVLSEPEAAAIYALCRLEPHSLQIGDTFVICDAGGGTVDLISYSIVALKPQLILKEAAPGSGALCGSEYLNFIFRDYIQEKLGNLDGWDDEVLEEAMKKFERVKKSFDGDISEDHRISVPGVQDNVKLGVRRGKFCLPGEVLRDIIFEPVMQEILSLVAGQIRSTKSAVKAILLVGGFGQSEYLWTKIQDAHKGIEVMQSPNGWTAVARGALMKALKQGFGVQARVARKYYGIRLARPYDKRKGDPRKDRKWDNFEGAYYISTMHWFIKQGEEMKENNPVHLLYRKEWRKQDTSQQKLYPQIYCFEALGDEGPPTYSNEDGVELLAKIDTDLSQIRKTNMPIKRGADDEDYYVVEFKIRVTHFSASTDYELLYNSHNYGALTVEYT